MTAGVHIDPTQIEEFCRRHGIRRLALFGSVLRDDFQPDHDVDVLVELQTDRPTGLITLAAIERELSELLSRKADLRTPAELNGRFRRKVLHSAEVLYAQR